MNGRRLKTTVVITVALASQLLTGCAGLNDRKQFAGHVVVGAAPILKGYRSCVQKEQTLTEDEKRMRLRLADEFERYIEGGSK